MQNTARVGGRLPTHSHQWKWPQPGQRALFLNMSHARDRLQNLTNIARLGDTLAMWSCNKPEHAFELICTPPWSLPNQTRPFGQGWGMHEFVPALLPTRGSPPGSCRLLSYGLSADTTVEDELVAHHGCHGIGFEPFAAATRGPRHSGCTQCAGCVGCAGLRFMKRPAPMLNSTRLFGSMGGFHSDVTVASALVAVSPALALADFPPLNHSERPLDILKMDCEGCEYAIASAVRALGMPDFFRRVRQFAVELHVHSAMLSSWWHLQELDALFGMLQEAGLTLIHAQFAGCAAEKGLPAQTRADDNAPDVWSPRRKPCLPSVEKAGWPCRLTCQNLLFARTRARTVFIGDQGRVQGV